MKCITVACNNTFASNLLLWVTAVSVDSQCTIDVISVSNVSTTTEFVAWVMSKYPNVVYHNVESQARDSRDSSESPEVRWISEYINLKGLSPIVISGLGGSVLFPDCSYDDAQNVQDNCIYALSNLHRTKLNPVSVSTRGVEFRYPYLDIRMIEYVLGSVHPKFRCKGVYNIDFEPVRYYTLRVALLLTLTTKFTDCSASDFEFVWKN